MTDLAAGTFTLTILHVRGPRLGKDPLPDPYAGLRADLAEMTDRQGLRPDILVVAGDLTDSGLPRECRRAVEAVAQLADSVGVPRRHVALVPGTHDVNRRACEAHFLMQEGLGEAPVPPYFPKWGAYAAAFREFYHDVPGATFEPDEPWSLFEMPDLGVVVAGLNSTMAESHRAEDQYGLVGQAQLRWFAARLGAYEREGWLRLGAINTKATRDAADLDRTLTAPGLVNLLLTGSEAPSGDGYQVIRVQPGGLIMRRHPGGRWIADDRAIVPERAGSGRDAVVAGRDINFNVPTTTRPETFLDRVGEAARLRFPTATIAERALGTSRYLRVSVPMESAAVEVHPVGVIDGSVTQEALDSFTSEVHAAFAAADPGVRSELVYSGSFAPDALVDQARRRGIRLRSFIEYQGLLDLRPLAERQRQRLDADRIYPAPLYVEQRFSVVPGAGTATAPVVRVGLVRQAVEWLSADAARLVVVLGDFGRGKTAFLRQLCRALPAELPALTPLLVDLRTLEKGPTLDDLLAQYLIRNGVEDVSRAKLRYMVDSGRVALLFDGFDELEVRVGYDNAADYLRTLLSSLTGQSKMVLTSRTQHFRSTAQVHTAIRYALGERVGTRTGSRIAILEDFTEEQVLSFLVNLYDGDAGRARSRFDLIGHVAGLLDLVRNPRMLAFVAQLTDERLLAVQSAESGITASGLYAEIIDYWLSNEEARQSHSRGLAALTKNERFAVCSSLALRMWSTVQPAVSLRDLTAEAAATVSRLAERGFSDDQAAHSVASGSLLVRTEDDQFAFIHQSIMEWLVAEHAARGLSYTGTASVLEARPMSRLMTAFFTDLADRDVASRWARAALAEPDAAEPAKRNAMAVLDLLGPGVAAVPDLSGVDLRLTDLNGRDLRGAILRGANLRGMRLADVNLDGADLRDADLTGTLLTGGSLRGAILDGSRWHGSVLLGTHGLDDPMLARSRELDAAAIAGRDVAGVVTQRPAASALCVAFSPDGALLAYGSGVLASICDAATGKTLRILRGHSGEVAGLAFSPDGAIIATASDDGTARVWDPATGLQRVVLTGHDGPVTAVACSPDGAVIATASHDGTARIWDAGSGQPRSTLTGHRSRVYSIVFSPDASLVATASHDGTARVWDPGNGAERLTLTGHDGPVTAIAFAPDGSTVATVGDDRTARVWDSATGISRLTLTGHRGAVTAVAFAPDGTRIATASVDGTTRIWDAGTGIPLSVLTGHRGLVTAVAYSPDGTRIATASADGTVRTWDAVTSSPRTALTGHDDPVTALALSLDGARLATVDKAGTVRVWDARTGTTSAQLTAHAARAVAVAFSPDARYVAVGSDDGTARVWDPAMSQLRTTLAGHRGCVTNVTVSPDGTLIATASDDFTARIWDTATGRPRNTLTGHQGRVYAVAFSPDGIRVATASHDRRTRIWAVSDAAVLAEFTGHAGPVTAVAFAPDGRLIATGSSDRTVRILGVPGLSGAEPLPIVASGHDAAITSVAFSPDGTWLVTASDDRTARIWDVADGSAVATFTGHDAAVTGAALTSDRALLVTASADGTIRIWDAATARTAATLVPLDDGGYATLLPDGGYKLHGDPGDRLWWAIKLCRLGPGELDPYVPGIRRLPADAPIR